MVARIIGDAPAKSADAETGEWLPGYFRSEWRRPLLRGLEGVVRDPQGTAHAALAETVKAINRRRNVADFDQADANQMRYAIGSGKRYFTVFCKTGTLDPDNDGPLLEDSIFVFTAGIWDDQTGKFCRGITGAIYLEQATQGQAQRFAADLIRLLDSYPRYGWGEVANDCKEPKPAERTNEP